MRRTDPTSIEAPVVEVALQRLDCAAVKRSLHVRHSLQRVAVPESPGFLFPCLDAVR
jgi:hypothetical protein